MNNPLELNILVPMNSEVVLVVANCDCGDYHGAGAGGDCKCGSLSGGGH